jgi:diacylglycerol kinase (ATP)
LKTSVLVNPAAGGAEGRGGSLDRLLRRAATWYEEIRSPGQGALLAAELIEAGTELILVAGGDGTVHDVANGILRSGRPVTLGVVPLGTGNDFARTLAIPLDPEEALEVLGRGRVRVVDVFLVRFGTERSYGLNVTQGGFAGEIGWGMASSEKSAPGSLSYVAGAVASLADLAEYRTSITWEDGSREVLDVVSVTVANGRTAGGGFAIAPMASLEDGLLDVVIVRTGSLPELTPVAARLLAGSHTENDLVRHRTTRRIAVSSEPRMAFSVDGEALTREAVELQVVPKALRVLVGPDYRPEPEPRS